MLWSWTRRGSNALKFKHSVFEREQGTQAGKDGTMSALKVEIMAICAAFAVMTGVLIAVW
jgi:hypothetical protein